MYKEAILKTEIDNIEKHAYILVYDNIKQLKDFCKRLNIIEEEEHCFIYKSIDNNNKAYVIQTQKEDNENTIDPIKFLEKIYNTVNSTLFGRLDLLPEDHNWSFGYIAEQLGITIKWKKEE